MKGDLETVTVIVCLFLAAILFIGDPDLYDSIIYALRH